jgi:hypothetical protein
MGATPLKGMNMAARNKTIEAITATPEDDSGELPEWARPAGQDSPGVEESTEAPTLSATPALDNLLQWLVNEAASSEGDTASAMEAIVRQTLSAENPTQVLRQTLPIAASDFVEVPMLLLDFTVRESEFEGSRGLPYYASMQVMMGDPPEPRVVNAGSIKILAQLKRLRELDEWPQVVMIHEVRAARRGESAPLSLVQVDQPA